MALPIKATPILYGEDARRFIENMENPIPVSKERIEEIRNNFLKIKLKNPHIL